MAGSLLVGFGFVAVVVDVVVMVTAG